MQPKRFLLLIVFPLVQTEDLWAGRPGPAVSVALAGSAGFQVSAPYWASADRYVVGCDFLDLTFYFSFAGPLVASKVSILEQTGLRWVGKLVGVCLSSSTFPIRHRGPTGTSCLGYPLAPGLR